MATQASGRKVKNFTQIQGEFKRTNDEEKHKKTGMLFCYEPWLLGF